MTWKVVASLLCLAGSIVGLAVSISYDTLAYMVGMEQYMEVLLPCRGPITGLFVIAITVWCVVSIVVIAREV